VLSNLVATAFIIVVGLFCLFGVVFSPAWVDLLASGFHQVPGKFELAVKMTRIMFAFPAAGGAGRAGHGRAQRLQPVRRSRARVHVLQYRIGRIRPDPRLRLGPHLGIEPITGMAIGVVLRRRFATRLAIAGAYARRRIPLSSRHRLESSRTAQDLQRLMGPAILGNAAVQINVLVITNFASRIPGNGPVSWLGYSFRFMQLPLGLFGVAIASATLPSISRSAGRAISTNSAARSPNRSAWCFC
jgi:putative peptidoglycan lipid II flippase